MTARQKIHSRGGAAPRPVRAGAAIKAGGKASFPAGFYCGWILTPQASKSGAAPLFFIFYAPGGHGRGSLIACCF